MADKTKTPEREERLKSALRDNLRRRKAASRRKKADEAEQKSADKSG